MSRINSPTTCTDTGSGGSATSSGSWSAAATYPNAADVPSQLCVNMYDEHGSEGNPSNSAKDFDPVTNDDNSINTNAFDPTVGDGFCTQLRLANEPTTTATHASTGSLVLGPTGTMTDAATVTGIAAAGLPAGTVAFYACGPTTSNALCASTGTPVGTATLPHTGDTGFVSTGSSGTFTPTHVGTYCFAAVYTPATGSPYAGSTDNQTTTLDPNECATFTAASSTTATQANPSTLTLGPNGTVTDSVTVTGTPNAGLPTGTVAFYVCKTTGGNALCASTATPEGTASLPHTGDTGFRLDGLLELPSLPTQTGTYCFAAVFTPTNSNYTGSTDNQSGTLDPNECFTANSAPNASVVKSANPASGSTVIPGQTIGYTLTVAEQPAPWPVAPRPSPTPSRPARPT